LTSGVSGECYLVFNGLKEAGRRGCGVQQTDSKNSVHVRCLQSQSMHCRTSSVHASHSLVTLSRRRLTVK